MHILIAVGIIVIIACCVLLRSRWLSGKGVWRHIFSQVNGNAPFAVVCITHDRERRGLSILSVLSVDNSPQFPRIPEADDKKGFLRTSITDLILSPGKHTMMLNFYSFAGGSVSPLTLQCTSEHVVTKVVPFDCSVAQGGLYLLQARIEGLTPEDWYKRRMWDSFLTTQLFPAISFHLEYKGAFEDCEAHFGSLQRGVSQCPSNFPLPDAMRRIPQSKLATMDSMKSQSDTNEAGIVSNLPLWKCPKCSEILGKDGLNVVWKPGEDLSKVSGSGTCERCGAQYSQADIYGGLYDIQTSVKSEAPPKTASAVSAFVYQIKCSHPPSDPKQYAHALIQKKYPTMGINLYGVIGWPKDLGAEEAMVRYLAFVEKGRAPSFGTQFDWLACTDDSGTKIVALMFT